MSTDEGAWDLSVDEREAMVARTATGISSMCFFNGNKVSDDVAQAAAMRAEDKAYERARIESRTTTGSRPIDALCSKEVQRAYIRILSQHLLDCVKNGCADEVAAATGSAADSDHHRLDISDSGREFVTESMANKLFAPMLSEGSKVTSMKLSTKSIGADSAAVVERAIGNCRGTLAHADISDIIAGRPEAEVLGVLRTVSKALANCSLATLDVSDNALGEKGIRACAAVLTVQSGLRGLHLRNIGCSVAACAAVRELVPATTLEELRLHNNMSGDEGATEIAALLERNTGMQAFQMSASRVGIDGGVALISALARGTSLRALDLTGNPMAPELAGPLKSLLPQQAELTCLILSDLNLGSEGCEAVAKVLAGRTVAPKLRVLDVSQNEISSDVTPAVARALAAHRGTLQRVVLSDNELECAGAIHVATGLRGASALQELDLRTNMIGKVGSLEVARVMCANGGSVLRKLELDDNQIASDGIEQIASMLKDAFPDREVLGTVEENDEEGDPDDDGVLETAKAGVDGLDEDTDADDLDLSKMKL